MENMGYASLIIGLFMAFWIKLFFRKSDYNLFEIFVLLCFVSGISALFMSVISFFQGMLQLDLLLVSNSISTIYYFWAIGQFFDRKKAGSYIKAMLAFVVGLIVIAFISAVGAVIEIIVRH
jgi:O-antigen/teichoic acid export membrane protein